MMPRDVFMRHEAKPKPSREASMEARAFCLNRLSDSKDLALPETQARDVRTLLSYRPSPGRLSVDSRGDSCRVIGMHVGIPTLV